MKADGTIIIDTAIQDDGMKAGSKEVEAAVRRMATSVNDLGRKSQIALQKQAASFAKLNQAYADQERKVKDLEKEVEDYGNKRLPTQEYIEIQKQISEAEKRLARLKDRQEKFVSSGGKTATLTKEYKASVQEVARLEKALDRAIERQIRFVETGGNRKSRAFQGMEYDIENLRTQLEKAKAEKDKLTQQTEPTTVFRKMQNDAEELANTIRYAKGELHELERSGGAYTLGKDTKKFADLSNKFASESQKLAQMKESLGASYARVENEFTEYKKRLFGVDSANKKAAKSGNKLNKSLKGTKKAANGAQFGLTKMLGTSILLSFAFQAISAVMTRIREGFENLAQYSDDTNKALSMLMSSMTRLKNSFATAFSPLLEYVAPALTKFIDLLAESATWVAQLFAALSGKDTYVRAVKVEEDYAASLKDSNKELEEREKENEKVTFSFDQLIQAQEKSDTENKDEYTPPTPDEMFVTEEVPNQIKLQADAIKQTFSDLFAPLKQSWDAYGPAVLAAVSNAFSAIKQLAGDVGASFMQVWNAEGYGKAITDDLLITFANLAQTVANLVTQFDKAWVAGDTGTNILRHLGDIILEITGFLREASESLKNWAADLDFSPLLTSFDRVLVAIRPIVGDITDAILWLLNNALLPLAKWGIEQALPTVFDLIAAALGALHSVIEALKPLGTWLWESFLQPLGRWTGEMIISALGKITDLLDKFAEWADENQTAIRNITVAIASFFAAWKVTQLLGFIQMSGGVVKALQAIAKAIGGATAAKIVDKAETMYLQALYAVDFVKSLGKSIEELGKFTKELAKATAEKVLATTKQKALTMATEAWNAMCAVGQSATAMLRNGFTALGNALSSPIGKFALVSAAITGLIALADVLSRNWSSMTPTEKMISGLLAAASAAGVLAVALGAIGGAAGAAVVAGAITAGIAAATVAINAGKRAARSASYNGSEYYSTAAYAAIPYRMPRLATGTVVPPRAGEFAAILGDNKRETEVVSPLSTIKQALKEALAEAGMAGSGERDIHIELVLDGQRFARAVYKANNQETQRVGVRMVTNG